MRSDRRDAMGVGAAQSEVHTAAQIRCRPVPAIRCCGEAGIVESAVDIRVALDRVALIKMGVNVDQCRPNLATAEVDVPADAVVLCSRPIDAGELALLDYQIALH